MCAHELVAAHFAGLVSIELRKGLLVLSQVSPQTRELIESQFAGLIHLKYELKESIESSENIFNIKDVRQRAQRSSGRFRERSHRKESLRAPISLMLSSYQ